jgi:hypothetical protein
MHKLRLGRAGTARAPFKIDYRSFVVKLDKFLVKFENQENCFQFYFLKHDLHQIDVPANNN